MYINTIMTVHSLANMCKDIAYINMSSVTDIYRLSHPKDSNHHIYSCVNLNSHIDICGYNSNFGIRFVGL
jgi:hypothetical protein